MQERNTSISVWTNSVQYKELLTVENAPSIDSHWWMEEKTV